ncbi:MAG: RsmF rRNA methyltransferase first C-terminal domain-containing protein [Lachnospiraceae bacterium]|nr:RsmF rRNA methyltransferase first C-terminal domain-containing protein [Lachnospiraceae bacterium]
MKLPVEFENRMKEMLGSEYEEFIKSYDENKKTALRVNELKISVSDFEKIAPFKMLPVLWCKTGFCVEESEEKPGRYALHDAGAYYMQEPSAMSVAACVAPEPGMKVLDLCAAPGGKSSQLASFLQNEGLLVSNEINAQRARILSSNIERMGIRNCVVLNETPDRLSKVFEEYFDVVVVDAPCSGEGMFRKDQVAIDEWSLENVEMCANRQEEILEEAVKMVAPGGRLAYSTCTFAPAENENQIARLLSEYPEFSIEEVENFCHFDNGRPEWISDDVSDDIKASLTKSARLWPHKIEGEGHFVCILKKDGFLEDENRKEKPLKANKSTEKLIKEFEKQNLKDINIEAGRVVQVEDRLYLKPEALNINLNKLHIIRMGLEIGEIKKERLEPSHALAMALRPEEVIRFIDINEEDALKYRHGEEIRADVPNGWTLVCVNGVSLGWGKAVNQVIKNHYPKGLRIKY